MMSRCFNTGICSNICMVNAVPHWSQHLVNAGIAGLPPCRTGVTSKTVRARSWSRCIADASTYIAPSWLRTCCWGRGWRSSATWTPGSSARRRISCIFSQYRTDHAYPSPLLNKWFAWPKLAQLARKSPPQQRSAITLVPAWHESLSAMNYGFTTELRVKVICFIAKSQKEH